MQRMVTDLSDDGHHYPYIYNVENNHHHHQYHFIQFSRLHTNTKNIVAPDGWTIVIDINWTIQFFLYIFHFLLNHFLVIMMMMWLKLNSQIRWWWRRPLFMMSPEWINGWIMAMDWIELNWLLKKLDHGILVVFTIVDRCFLDMIVQWNKLARRNWNIVVLIR